MTFESVKGLHRKSLGNQIIKQLFYIVNSIKTYTRYNSPFHISPFGTEALLDSKTQNGLSRHSFLAKS